MATAGYIDEGRSLCLFLFSRYLISISPLSSTTLFTPCDAPQRWLSTIFPLVCYPLSAESTCIDDRARRTHGLATETRPSCSATPSFTPTIFVTHFRPPTSLPRPSVLFQQSLPGMSSHVWGSLRSATEHRPILDSLRRVEGCRHNTSVRRLRSVGRQTDFFKGTRLSESRHLTLSNSYHAIPFGRLNRSSRATGGHISSTRSAKCISQHHGK